MVDLAGFSHETTKRFPDEWDLGHLTADDVLAVWWVFSQLTEESISEAKASLNSGADGGVDAVRIDSGSGVIYLVQSKLRSKIDHAEKDADLNYLTRWANLFQAPDQEFNDALVGLSTTSAEHLRQARHALKLGGMKLEFQFVSTGTVSDAAIKRQPVSFRFYGGRRLLKLYEDYASGVQPISELELEVARDYAESAAPTGRRSIPGIELGVYLVSGGEIHRAVAKHPDRLFARNVRGYLGKSAAVNAKIISTIQNDPTRFRYMNNGITVVCDRAPVTREGGKHRLLLYNPQVVNGQQTSRSIANVTPKEAAGVQVIMKVVTINRDVTDAASYDRIVREIVEATNLQSRISASDLRANDKRQVDLYRALKKLGHYYARKTEPYGTYQLKAAYDPIVTRAKLADAVGGCLFESLPHRLKKDTLYEDPYFERIFDPDQAEHSLLCHYLWKRVGERLAPRVVSPATSQSKWLVLFALWKLLEGPLTIKSSKFIAFGKAAKPDATIRAALDAAIDSMTRGVGAFEAVHSKQIKLEGDSVRFFKRANLYPEFEKFLRTGVGKPLGRAVAQSAKAFTRAL